MTRLEYIKAIAVELEGGWQKQPTGAYGDGSVNSFRGLWSGEIASSHTREGSLKKLIPWLLINYPDKTDDSCGFHVHVSFKEKRFYEMAMTHTFPLWIACCAARWAKARGVWEEDENLRARIVHGNTYCARGFNADQQIYLDEKSSARYRQVNYCYTLHGTVELRMMPMLKTRQLAAEWVVYYTHCVEEFLRRMKTNAKEFEVEVKYRDMIMREEDLVCV